MTDGNRSRRRFLATGGTALLLGLAGCSSGSGPAEPPTGTQSSTPTDAATATPTAGDGHDHTHMATDDGTDDGTATERDAPGYKEYHWHGRLFFEVNGELVDFHQDKYFLKNIQEENPETVYFHFHEPKASHGPNEWSNEKQVVTFARALNLLPGITYERKSGAHVITYDGTTYDGRTTGTTVEIMEGTEPIDPTSHQVAHNDNYYVKVIDENRLRNVEPAHGGADLGTLLFDLNNRRLDFSKERFVGAENASEAFHFHDDGHPYLWYKEGSVTLADALDAIDGIQYAMDEGNHAIKFEDEDRTAYAGTYHGKSDEHEIIIRQRANDVDPTSYQLQAGDIIWVYVHSTAIPDNEH